MAVKQEREKRPEEEIQSLENSLLWRYAIRDSIITTATSITAAPIAVTLLNLRSGLVEVTIAAVVVNTLFNLYRANKRQERISEMCHSLLLQTATDPDARMRVELPRDSSPEDAQVSARSMIRTFNTGKPSLVVRNSETGKLEPVETVDN